MHISKHVLLIAMTAFLAVGAYAESDGTIELNIDGAIAAVSGNPEARTALEAECIALMRPDTEWTDLYRAVRILAVIGTEKCIPPLVALLATENTAHLARYPLETMPFPEISAALLDAIKTAPRKAQLGIIDAMARRKDVSAVKVLSDMVITTDLQIMENAARALAYIGEKESENLFMELLKSGDAHAEGVAEDALLIFAEQLVEKELAGDAANLYQRLLEPERPDHIRAGAFMGLLKALPRNAQDAVVQAIKSDDAILRATGIAAVAGLPVKGTSARFCAELSSLAPDIQAPLLESLTRRDESMETAFLHSLLKDAREEVRIAAMKAIAVQGNADSIAPVGGLLVSADMSRTEKQAAGETLRRLKGDGIDTALVQYMQSTAPGQRSDLIDVIVQRCGAGALDACMAQTAEEPARAAAFRGIGQLAEAEHLDTVLGLLVGLQGETGREEAENAVAILARKLGQSAGELTITKALYGNLPNGEYVDVTGKVAERVENGVLTITASNDLFGDSAPGTVKKLRVEYAINGIAGERTVPELVSMTLSAQAISPEAIEKIAAALNAAGTDEGRASLLRVLSRLGGQKGFEVVSGYLNNESPLLQEAAVRALSSWPDSTAAGVLADIFSSTQDAAKRSIVLRGCVRLLRQGALPQAEAVDVYRKLSGAAASADERKQMLSGLAELIAPEAVGMIQSMLKDEAVKEEAQLAFDRVKSQLGEEAFNAALNALPPEVVQDSTFISIFNGKDLEGWSGDPALWRVEDGCLVGETREDAPLEHNTFITWEGGEVEDFDLKFRFKTESEWINSGIQIRSERFEGYRVRGYQPDIASEDWITGICYEEGGRGILARRGQSVVFGADGQATTTVFGEEAALADYILKNDWNEYHVCARGNRFYSRINGHKMHEVTDDAPEARKRGILAFQLHAGPAMKIRFADIMLKRVAPSAAK